MELCFISIQDDDAHLSLPSRNLVLVSLCSEVPLEISSLMDSFVDIFVEPKELPHHRPGFDHLIPLKEGTGPFNLRSYRYSTITKNLMHKLVGDMIEQGVI